MCCQDGQKFHLFSTLDNALSSTILSSAVPKKSLLKPRPAGSTTTVSVPVLEKSIQNMRFLDATVRRNRIGPVMSAPSHMDIPGLCTQRVSSK
jgi:hypothetical protein